MAITTFSKTMDTAGINAAIKSIQTRGAKLDSDIQLTGLSVLAHIEKYKEPSLFLKLFNAMPAGSRRNALVKWATTFGKVAVNMDKKTSKATPFLYNAEGVHELATAELKPWFTFKPEASPRETFDLDAWLLKAQDLIKSKVKTGAIDQHDRRVEIFLALTGAAPVVAEVEEPEVEQQSSIEEQVKAA